MSLTDSDTFNGPDPAGCAQPAPAVPVEQVPFEIALDQFTDVVCVTLPLRMGGWGVSIGLDGSSATGYVPDNVDGTISMFALNRWPGEVRNALGI